MPPKSRLIKRAKLTSFKQRHIKNEIAVRVRAGSDQARTYRAFRGKLASCVGRVVILAYWGLLKMVTSKTQRGSGKFQFPAPKWPPDPVTPNFLEGPPVAAIEERASRKFFERLVGAASPESGARRRRWFRDRHSHNWALTLDRLLLRPA